MNIEGMVDIWLQNGPVPNGSERDQLKSDLVNIMESYPSTSLNRFLGDLILIERDKATLYDTLEILSLYDDQDIVEKTADTLYKIIFSGKDGSKEMFNMLRENINHDYLDEMIESLNDYIKKEEKHLTGDLLFDMKDSNGNKNKININKSSFHPFMDTLIYFTDNDWNTSDLLSQSKQTYSQIARAHAICEKNCPDDMDEFYSNLRQKLDSGEAKEWAIAAYEAFQGMDNPGEMTVIERCAANGN